MALSVLRNEGNIDVIAGIALKIYCEANDWVETSTFKRLLGEEYAAQGRTINLSSGGQYLGKMKPALYFGLLEAKSENRKNFHRITDTGRAFYEAYQNGNENVMVDILMNAIKTTTFGRNNPAVNDSDSDIEAPVVFLKANLILSGISTNEYAYILQELENHRDFDQLLCEVALNRKTSASYSDLILNNSFTDDKSISFLCGTGLTEDKQRTKPILDSYIQRYSNDIKNLSIFRKGKVDSVITPETRKEAFAKYLNNKCSAATAAHLLRDIEKDVVVDSVLELTDSQMESIYEITDPDIADMVSQKVSADPRNRDGEENYAGYPLTACNHYKEFIKVFVNGKLCISKPIQKIYYGAPGTGKSQFIKKREKKGDLICKRITFHPDTDYAAFVGSYKPIMGYDEDGNEIIKYSFQEQTFLECYYAAWNNPQENYAIVIEELNRGNCAQIFGDIFQLLDRREDGYSDYPIVVDKDIQQAMRANLPLSYASDVEALYLDDSNKQSYIKNGWEVITLPPNLSIYATMNTSDNSLYKMDSAFKRRWRWEYVKINYQEPELSTVKLAIPGLTGNHWLTILEKINLFIKNETLSTSKQIGQWFVLPEKDNGRFTDITFFDFRDKVMFYLFNDVFKDTDSLKDIIAPGEEIYLYEDLVLSDDEGVSKCKSFIEYLQQE